MKQAFKLLVIMFFVSSCTPGYEKAIADWVQTDKNGTWTDMKFKILEVYDTKDLTVGDSIFILRQRFEKVKELKLDSCRKAHNRALLAFYSRYNQKARQEVADRRYAEFKKYLDSIPFRTNYDQRDTAELLGRYMRCRYSFFSSRLNTEQKEDGIFLLTPDLERCFGSVSNKFYEKNKNQWKKW